jgi:hypothetical protein
MSRLHACFAYARAAALSLIVALIVLLNGAGALFGLKGPIEALWHRHPWAVILGAPTATLAFAILVILGIAHLQAEHPPR